MMKKKIMYCNLLSCALVSNRTVHPCAGTSRRVEPDHAQLTHDQPACMGPRRSSAPWSSRPRGRKGTGTWRPAEWGLSHEELDAARLGVQAAQPAQVRVAPLSCRQAIANRAARSSHTRVCSARSWVLITRVCMLQTRATVCGWFACHCALLMRA